LLLLPSSLAQMLFQSLSPGAALLAKWLPVFFVPSLVTLPLADSVGTAGEVFKMGAIIVGGFFLTLLTTAWSVVAVQNLVTSIRKQRAKKFVTPILVVDESTKSSTATPAQSALATTTTATTAVAPTTAAATAKPFSAETLNALTLLTLISGIASATTYFVGKNALSGPLSALFLLCTTLTSFVFGARLPKKFVKIIHPLIVTTTGTWVAASALGLIEGRSFRTMLKFFRTGTLVPFTRAGAGDILLYLLGPAVVSLAISMYDRRKLVRDNAAAVSTSIGVSTLGGLFGTALAVRWLNIGDPALRLSLLSRNITSPLAMAIASILGADVSLAVTCVVVTGLLGANFGATILTKCGIRDPVARGLSLGAAAHGLGTAAMTNEKDAFPFAAIAMALTASAATIVASIPVLKRVILELALG